MNVPNECSWAQHQVKGYTQGGQRAASDVKTDTAQQWGTPALIRAICPYGLLPTAHTVKQNHPDLS